MTLDFLTLEEHINAGELDSELMKIISAANERLARIRKTKTVKDFHIGDRVVLNDLCGTAYLRGHTASVVGLGRTKLRITLDKPVGRFLRVVDGLTHSAEINVPPSIVDAL